MKKSTIVMLSILAFIVAIIGGLVVVFVFLDIRQETKLNLELTKISNMNLNVDTVDMDIKTKGEYAIIEGTIKNYFNEYSNYLKGTNDIINEDRLAKILSIDNYNLDGPDFVHSFEYLKDIKTRFDEKVNHLQEMGKKSYMENLIKNKNLSKDNIDLYNKYMFDGIDDVDFSDFESSVKNAKTEMENNINSSKETLQFLKDNQDYWYTEGEYIMFDNDDLLNQYNKLISPTDKAVY